MLHDVEQTSGNATPEIAGRETSLVAVAVARVVAETVTIDGILVVATEVTLVVVVGAKVEVLRAVVGPAGRAMGTNACVSSTSAVHPLL